jgi:hypothetical protein
MLTFLSISLPCIDGDFQTNIISPMNEIPIQFYGKSGVIYGKILSILDHSLVRSYSSEESQSSITINPKVSTIYICFRHV